jgi:hypothetical protein
VPIAYVDFSERVTGSVNAIQLGYADGTMTSCVPDDPAAPKPIANTTNAGVTPGKAQPAAGFSSLSFNCSAAIDHSRAIVLSIAQGLKSTSGPALDRGAAAQRSIAPSDWTSWAGGGNLWRVALTNAQTATQFSVGLHSSLWVWGVSLAAPAGW